MENDTKHEHEQCIECGLMTAGPHAGTRIPLPPILWIDKRGQYGRHTSRVRSENVEPAICPDCQNKLVKERLKKRRR